MARNPELEYLKKENLWLRRMLEQANERVTNLTYSMMDRFLGSVPIVPVSGTSHTIPPTVSFADSAGEGEQDFERLLVEDTDSVDALRKEWKDMYPAAGGN